MLNTLQDTRHDHVLRMHIANSCCAPMFTLARVLHRIIEVSEERQFIVRCRENSICIGRADKAPLVTRTRVDPRFNHPLSSG